MHIYIYMYVCMYAYIYILEAPCFKNLLRLEAGYPALRCHNLNKTQVTRTGETPTPAT